MKSRMKSKSLSEYWLTLPSLLWLLFFFLIPSLVIFAFAFKPSDLYGNLEEGWTVQNLYQLYQKGYFAIIWRTLWLSFTATLISLALAIPTCYYMARTSKRMRNFLILLVVIPFWSSFLIRIFAWKSLLHPDGFLKSSLVFLGIIDPDTSLLYHSGTVLFLMVYAYLPFAILPLFAAASKFDFQLFEAVLDLGGTRTLAFFKVFLPGIQKGILTALLMVLIPALGAYLIPDVVGGTQSEMIGNKIAQRAFIERNLPLASMLSLFLGVIVLIPMGLIYLLQKNRSQKMLVAMQNRE